MLPNRPSRRVGKDSSVLQQPARQAQKTRIVARGFRPRQTRPLGVRAIQGWSLKWYSINVIPEPIQPEIIAAAEEVVAGVTPIADVAPALGFVIVHRGAESVWLLPALWRGDILYQRTFGAPLSQPTRFEEVGVSGGPTACVWELVVHAHERDAFVAHVLSRPSAPDSRAYLSDVTSVEVGIRSRTTAYGG